MDLKSVQDVSDFSEYKRIIEAARVAYLFGDTNAKLPEMPAHIDDREDKTRSWMRI